MTLTRSGDKEHGFAARFAVGAVTASSAACLCASRERTFTSIAQIIWAKKTAPHRDEGPFNIVKFMLRQHHQLQVQLPPQLQRPQPHLAHQTR